MESTAQQLKDAMDIEVYNGQQLSTENKTHPTIEQIFEAAYEGTAAKVELKVTDHVTADELVKIIKSLADKNYMMAGKDVPAGWKIGVKLVVTEEEEYDPGFSQDRTIDMELYLIVTIMARNWCKSAVTFSGYIDCDFGVEGVISTYVKNDDLSAHLERLFSMSSNDESGLAYWNNKLLDKIELCKFFGIDIFEVDDEIRFALNTSEDEPTGIFESIREIAFSHIFEGKDVNDQS